jgi:hypothetical protein
MGCVQLAAAALMPLADQAAGERPAAEQAMAFRERQ